MPLNGALWTGSHDWPLSSKMQTDFPDDLLSRLAVSEGEVRLRPIGRQLQPVVSAGGASLDVLALSNDQTAAALSAAGAQTRRALRSSTGNVGKSLKRARAFLRQGPARRVALDILSRRSPPGRSRLLPSRRGPHEVWFRR